MIILYDDNEVLFTGLGLGALKDARSCKVSESLNDSYELQFSYPITGQHYNKLAVNKIVSVKPNPYSGPQPFRITNISKPINGNVTVDAVHISYDMNGLPVAPINGSTLQDTLDKIQNGAIIPHNFKLYTDKPSTKTFKTTNYYNMRSLILGSEDSLLKVFEGELYFDKFNVYLLEKRGSNKGAQVRYAKNLKDITHEINYERLYNGVYPFYHQEETSQSTSTSTDGFKQVYIVGSKPYQDGWLSYTNGGEPYHPVDESPVQIASEGSYNGKVYVWNTSTQRFTERLYNESCTLIDNLGSLLKSEETPTWVKIDWTGLPRVVCIANVDGYFKLITETEWTYRKKGDTVFDNSIKDAATNIMLYYSEVIPPNTNVKEEETTTVTHVELEDKIIWLDTDVTKEMKFNRILSLDLTSEFDETPDQTKLEAKAREYIEKNKIGQYKYTTTVSFIDLSSTTEGVQYKNVEQIELGDTVKVVYEDLGVDVDLRVISTVYDVLLDRYDKIELGEKADKISGESVQNGDNISSLTNDVGYADINTVNKLVAKIVTADYIKAKNAELSKAQIEQLETARIKCTGIIEATQFEMDTLIAKMLTADNAVIKQTLEAGTVKVKGDISIIKGEITIGNTETDTVFRVDRDGNLTANSVKITGGELNINDTFSVTPDGILSAQGASISGDIKIESGSITISNKFSVTEEGILTATEANITGTIHADTGEIAGFNIENDTVKGKYMTATSDGVSVIISPSYTTVIDSNNKKWVFIAGLTSHEENNTTIYSAPFKVSTDGNVYASSLHINGGDLNINNAFKVSSLGAVEASNLKITGGEIEIKNNTLNKSFKVDSDGNLTANSVKITGGELTIGGSILNDTYFNVTNSGAVTAKGITIQNGSISIQDVLGTNSFVVTSAGDVTTNSIHITGGDLNINNKFIVTNLGAVTASDLTITGGSIEIKDGNVTKFEVTNTGIVSAADIRITGGNMNVGNGTFTVSDQGILYANGATIVGNITATTGYIGTAQDGFSIDSNSIHNGTIGTSGSVLVCTGTSSSYTIAGEAKTGWAFAAGANFGVLNDGSVYASAMTIKGGTLNINDNFIVDATGKLTATGADITGKITATSGEIAGLTISSTEIKLLDNSFWIDPTAGFTPYNGSYNLKVASIKTTYIQPITWDDGRMAVIFTDGVSNSGSDAGIQTRDFGDGTGWGIRKSFLKANRISNIPTITNEISSDTPRNPYMIIYNNITVNSNGYTERTTTTDINFSSIWAVFVQERTNGNTINNNLKVEYSRNNWDVYNNGNASVQIDVLVIGIPSLDK